MMWNRVKHICVKPPMDCYGNPLGVLYIEIVYAIYLVSTAYICAMRSKILLV